MTSLVARQYVISRLNEMQLNRLHQIEKATGFCMVPAQIHERFKTHPWGTVDDSDQERVAPEISAIFGQVESQAAAKRDFDDVAINHRTDLEVRRRGLDFKAKRSAGSAREALMAGGF